MAEPIISVSGLRKSYGPLEAVRGIDLDVQQGEIVAVLGPNGAGKTTTVEILEGYRKRTAGEVRVLGTDPARAGREWMARVGMMLQNWQVEPDLTVRESLEQFAGYYPRPRGVEEICGAGQAQKGILAAFELAHQHVELLADRCEDGRVGRVI